MKKYSEFRPTSHDPAGLGCDDRQDWLVGPCGTNRDADVRTRANWKALNNVLDEIDPDGNDHEVHRFGHWGPGWFEIVLVRPDTKCAEEAESIENGLADYPCVSDEVLSEEEDAEITSIWENSSVKERLEYIQEANDRGYGNGPEHVVKIWAARKDEMPGGNVWDHLRERYC